MVGRPMKCGDLMRPFSEWGMRVYTPDGAPVYDARGRLVYVNSRDPVIVLCCKHSDRFCLVDVLLSDGSTVKTVASCLHDLDW